MPEEAGPAELLNILPDELKLKYSNPLNLIRPKNEQQPSKYTVMAEDGEYPLLIKRMHQQNMVTFTKEPMVINGVFGVVKDVTKQRLIIDARPANALFVESPPVELPTPDLFANFIIPDDKQLYVAKADLCNFYHRIKLPPQWHPYFALPAVRAGDVDAKEFDENDMIHPCCATLPMGFSHSVYLAQMAHLNIINSRTSLQSTDQITRNGEFELNRLRHCIYIDDSVMVSTMRYIVHKMNTLKRWQVLDYQQNQARLYVHQLMVLNVLVW